jgi:hypothetical protein
MPGIIDSIYYDYKKDDFKAARIEGQTRQEKDVSVCE